MEAIENKYFFITFTRNDFASLDSFIDSWAKNYNYPNMESYTEVIFKDELTKTDLEKLFTWKNGMRLSLKKEKSFQVKISDKLQVINELKNNWDKNKFNMEFEALSPIWKIFLLHIIAPEQYPIFDQHVYRAFKYIVDHVNDENQSLTNKSKMKIYYEDYLPFYLNCKDKMSERFTSKQLDNALWLFGKFLNEYSQLVL